MTTGPAHWELLQRARSVASASVPHVLRTRPYPARVSVFPLVFLCDRAVDNQVYVATASPARDENAGYVAWGHSSVVNPWSVLLCAFVCAD